MSYDHTGTNGARNASLNMENLAKYREPVLRREERYLKETKTIVSRPMKR